MTDGQPPHPRCRRMLHLSVFASSCGYSPLPELLVWPSHRVRSTHQAFARPLAVHDTGQPPVEAPAAACTWLALPLAVLEYLCFWSAMTKHSCQLTMLVCLFFWQTLQADCVDMFSSSFVTQDKRLIPIRSPWHLLDACGCCSSNLAHPTTQGSLGIPT